MLPTAIDIRITSKCNLCCSFCFGTKCNDTELSIDKWYELIDKFKANGVKFLVITGGEPALYNNINKFIEYAKNKKFNIILSTNGIMLDKIDCLEYIDILSLPLDGESYFDCNTIRNLSYNDYCRTKDNIINFKKKYPTKRLKIGTVVTKKNINKIVGIFDDIIGYADIWKLYQVSKHKNNEKIYNNQLYISDEEFEQLYQYIMSIYGNDIKIVAYRNIDRNGKYLFCEPNGDAMIINQGRECIIGNFYRDFKDVVNKWKEYVNLSLLMENINDTYMY